MRSLHASQDRPAPRAESFTARTLRLSVRTAPIEPVARPAPAIIVVEPELEPEQLAPEPVRLLVRLQAVCTPSVAEPGDEMPSPYGVAGAPRFGIAGLVEAIEGHAQGVNVGDAVFGVASTRRLPQVDELIVVEAFRMARMPSRIGFRDAAKSSLNATSAWQMLFKIGRLDAGETVLILGADTPIGAFAVQLAAAHGVKTIALVMSPGSEAELLARGAHRVIDASPGRLEAQCWFASVVVDTLGGVLQQRAAAALQSGCTLVSCVQRPDAFTTGRRRTRSLFCVPDVTTQCLARIATLIDEHHITTRTIESEFGRD